MAPSRGQLVPDDVSDFMRALLIERIAGGMIQTRIADASGLVDTTISDFRVKKRGLGWHLLIGLMQAFHLSFEQIDVGVRAWRRGIRPASACVSASTDESPKGRAYEFARYCGLSEGAIQWTEQSALLGDKAPALSWFMRVHQFQQDINANAIPPEPPATPAPTGGLIGSGALKPKRRKG